MRKLFIAVALITFWAGVLPIAASAEPAPTWDLFTKAKKLSSPGGLRKVRITVGNNGPDDFHACTTFCVEDGFIGVTFNAAPSGIGTTDVTTDADCSIDPDGFPETSFTCDFGESLPVGDTRSVTVTFPKGNSEDYIVGGYAYHWEGGPDTEGFADDPVSSNNLFSLVFDASVSEECSKAKDKVAKLKRKIAKAHGKKKRELKKQLAKAKKDQKEACD